MPLRAFLLLAAIFAPGLALAAEGPGLLTDNGSSLVLATASLALLHALLQHRRIRAAEARARFFAHHEPLTGLLNRPHFLEALEKALASRREDQALTALSIDLDGLREINDLHGPESGDAAIVQFSNALVRLAGPGALVGRFGGDKFAVALWSRPGSAALRELAMGILKAAEGPFAAGGTSVRMEAQIGIATAPGDADTAARLLKAAGLALDRARLRGGSGYEVFERTLETELQQRRDLEKQIRETLAEDAFDLHFQPLFDTDQTRLTGFEALLRMPNRRGGFVSPAIFIPVAEEIGLITEIGDWVLRRACALAAHWPDHLCVAVNLSPAQFGTGAVCRTVRQALQEAGLPPHRLELEITEGLVLNDDAGIRRELTELKELGVSIVMDDFGTGYSSLSYLWKFPFDKIKIDRSFMGALGVEDRQVTDVIQAILSLSRSLHMRVTAEGVETREQAAFLKTIGCDEVQGFYFGRPMPVDEVALAILRDVQAEIRTDTADPLRRAG